MACLKPPLKKVPEVGLGHVPQGACTRPQHRMHDSDGAPFLSMETPGTQNDVHIASGVR